MGWVIRRSYGDGGVLSAYERDCPRPAAGRTGRRQSYLRENAFWVPPEPPLGRLRRRKTEALYVHIVRLSDDQSIRWNRSQPVEAIPTPSDEINQASLWFTLVRLHDFVL